MDIAEVKRQIDILNEAVRNIMDEQKATPKTVRSVKVGDLEWQADVPDEKFTWEEAKAYADSLGDGWRLPTVQELVSLWDYDKGCCPTFPGTKGWFWSSSPLDNHVGAWSVYFDLGLVGYSYRHAEYSVRCVR